MFPLYSVLATFRPSFLSLSFPSVDFSLSPRSFVVSYRVCFKNYFSPSVLIHPAPFLETQRKRKRQETGGLFRSPFVSLSSPSAYLRSSIRLYIYHQHCDISFFRFLLSIFDKPNLKHARSLFLLRRGTLRWKGKRLVITLCLFFIYIYIYTKRIPNATR